MKRDKILLTAIIGVVVAILGFVFLSDGSEASGDGDGKKADNSTSETTGAALTTLDNRMVSDPGGLISPESEELGRDLVEWPVPAGIRDFQAAALELTGVVGDSYELARWNGSLTGPLEGQTVRIPRVWKAARDSRLAANPSDPAGPSKAGTSGAGAKKAAAKPEPAPAKAPKKKVAAAEAKRSARFEDTSTPWDEFLLKPGAAKRGSGAPRNASAAVDTGAGAPLAREPKAGSRYVIRKGDSLWKLAKAAYGKGHLWSRILEANPRTLPSETTPLRPGKVIYIPK